MSPRPATKKRKKTRLPDVLSRLELELVLNAPRAGSVVNLRNRVALALMGRLGLRASEVCRLELRDVRLKADDPYLRVIGKGDKERRGYVGAGTLDLLKLWLDHRPPGGTALLPVIKSTTSPAGHRSKPGRAMSRQGLYEIVRNAARKAGIDRPVHPHTLRHTAATLALGSGENLRRVQEMLGHADVSTTQVYTHVANKELADMARRLDPVGMAPPAREERGGKRGKGKD